jgi:hypothetical protein
VTISDKNKTTYNKYLITLTDGSDMVTYSFPLFLSSLVKSESYQYFDGIFFLFPSYTNPTRITDNFNKYPELSIFPVTLEFQQPSDRYYVKLLIKDFLNRSYIDVNDHVLYLDYDHVFRNHLSLPFLKPNTIFVSSDVKSTNDLLQITEKQEIQIPRIHYNTSLIMGRKGDLLLAMSDWAKYYKDFSEYFPVRYLEEISFYGSAQNSGITLTPISVVFQGTWFSYKTSSQIFHLGGEYTEAKIVKKYILETMKHIDYSSDMLAISEQLLAFIEDKLWEWCE